MPVACPRRTAALSALVAASLLLAACAGARPQAPKFRLIEKGRYQVLYGADGRLERVLFDEDGDRRADVIVFFDSNGKPSRSEIDSDRDGVIDRSELIINEGLWVEEVDADGDGVVEHKRLHGPGDAVRDLGFPH
jgi:hypothetical protein